MVVNQDPNSTTWSLKKEAKDSPASLKKCKLQYLCVDWSCPAGVQSQKSTSLNRHSTRQIMVLECTLSHHMLQTTECTPTFWIGCSRISTHSDSVRISPRPRRWVRTCTCANGVWNEWFRRFRDNICSESRFMGCARITSGHWTHWNEITFSILHCR
jgi:hypothetical protein